jgi:hypothetical protein
VKSSPGKHHLDPEWALQQLPGDEGEAWRVLFEHGSLEIEVYAPDDFATWVVFYGPEGGE